MKPLHLYLTAAKIFTDYCLIVFSFTLAYFLRVGFYFSSEFLFFEYLYPALFTAPLWLIIMYYARGYEVELRSKSFRHFERVVFVCLVGIAFYIITYFFLRKLVFSRLMIAMVLALSILFVYFNHLFFFYLAKRFYTKGIGTFPTLIIGTTREAEKLIKKLKIEQSIHQPVAILDGYGTTLTAIAQVPIVGKMNKLAETVQKYHIEQIIQTDNLEQTINIISFANQHHLKYAMLPTLLGVYGQTSKVEEVEGIPVVRVE
jgi:FlaA1/EpsC-like NDP-sugar epimerase